MLGNAIRYEKQINKLHRVLLLVVYNWGIDANVYDKGMYDKSHFFVKSRRFNFTPKYPTKEDNIKRALSYFKMADATQIND